MPNRRIPSYRLYKPKNLGLVVLNGKYLYLGKYGTPESLAEYHRLIQEWLADQHVVRRTSGKAIEPNINEMLVAYWKHAEQHYRDADGEPTGELNNLRYALRPLRKLYGHTPAKNFGPLALRAIREQMIETGLCRTVINARVNRIRRAFRWAASVEMIPVAVIQAIATVAGLGRGRSKARESKGVHPVDWALVETTLPHLPRPVAMPCVLGGMAQVSDGGTEEAPDRLADPEPNAIGVPSAELSLGWMLASRANLRFTRRESDTASVSAMQDQPRVAGQEGWQKCS